MKQIKEMSLIEVWDRADAIRPVYYEAKTAVEKDADLTLEARTRKLSELSDVANTELAQLKAAWFAGKTTRKEEIVKRAFGIGFRTSSPTDADWQAAQMNYRSALERAARAEKPGELNALLEQADITGDTMLKKAVGLEARRKGFTEVLRAAMDDSDDYRELMALDDKGKFVGENTHFTRVN